MHGIEVGSQTAGGLRMAGRYQTLHFEPTHNIDFRLPENGQGSGGEDVIRGSITSDSATLSHIQCPVTRRTPLLQRVDADGLCRHANPDITRANKMFLR